MKNNNQEDNTYGNKDNCDNCHSPDLHHDDSRGQIFCVDCGYVCNDEEFAIDGKEMTWGDSPQNTASDGLGGAAIPPSRPRGYTGKANDYRRLRKADGRARFAPPPYVIRSARTLEQHGEQGATVKGVQSTLAEADSIKNETSLADQRPPLRGYSRLPEGRHEQPEYRKKALALAALALDDHRGLPTRYRVLAESMGVDVEDVIRLRKMLARRVPDRERARLKELADSISDPSEAARALRQAMLESALDHIHSMIHDIIIHDHSAPSGLVTALDIRERAIHVLQDSQEPMRGGPMGNGQYASFSAHKAAMLATFEAVKSLGLPMEFCRELFRLVPVPRMKTNMRRLGSWWKKSDDADKNATGHA